MTADRLEAPTVAILHALRDHRDGDVLKVLASLTNPTDAARIVVEVYIHAHTDTLFQLRSYLRPDYKPRRP